MVVKYIYLACECAVIPSVIIFWLSTVVDNQAEEGTRLLMDWLIGGYMTPGLQLYWMPSANRSVSGS